MLFDVGEAIEDMLRRRCSVPTDVEIVFEAPTKDWASRRSAPAIDVFLYDIRENLDRRQNLLEFTRDEGIAVGRVPATRWYSCSYLITAWTQRAEDEHRLLGGIIEGLLTVHSIPRESLTGRMATMEREFFLTLGRPLGSERSISDIWSALGGELKPSLDLVVAVPFEPHHVDPVGPPVLEAPSLYIADGADPDAVRAELPKDDPGRTPGHRRAKRPSEERSDALLERRGDPSDRSETVVGGTPDRPGRRFRFSVHEPGPGDT
jgi:hypothetical protein